MTITKGMKINQKIRNRVLRVANFILATRSTVRDAAKEFGVSKSTVHKDVSERLAIINPELYEEIKVHLKYHTSIRHLRGGEATKQMYKGNSKFSASEERVKGA